MIAKYNQPLSTVENKGFINLINVSSPNFKIPSRRDISRRLEGKYNQFQDFFKNELIKVKYISNTYGYMDRYPHSKLPRSYCSF